MRREWRLPAAMLLVAMLAAATALGRLPWQIMTVYAVLGMVSFLAYRRDKRLAETGQWRISEAMLLGMDFCGGIVGGLLGQALFRHKTSKPSYIAATVAIALVHLLWLAGSALGLIRPDDFLRLMTLVSSGA